MDWTQPGKAWEKGLLDSENKFGSALIYNIHWTTLAALEKYVPVHQKT